MFFKLLNISTNSNFSTIPQVPNSGLLSNQNKSQQKINTRDLSLNNDILVDLQKFDKNGQLEQVLEDQTNKLNSSSEHNGVTAPAPQRNTLNTQNRKKSKEDILKRKDGRLTASPNHDDDPTQQIKKTEDTITLKENASDLKDISQKNLITYPKSFFTEIDESANKQNNLKARSQIKSKTRDQSLMKTVNKAIYDSQGQIQNQRNHPSQLEIGVSSYLRNSRPKTNNTITGNGRGNISHYNYNQRAHTTSHSDQNDTLGNSNALRDRSMQDLKNRSGDSYLVSSNKPNLLQAQRMDNQFKNFFSTSARSVSAKRNQSLVRNNLVSNNPPKKNLSINESKVNLSYNNQQIKQINVGSTRNANNNLHHYNGYRNNPYIYYSNNNNSHSLNNSNLNNSNINNSNNNSFNKDIKINQYNNLKLRNNFINTDSSFIREKGQSSNHLSKSAIHDKVEKNGLKHLAYTPQQMNNDPKIIEEYKKQSQEMYKQYKISFEQISPYSSNNHYNAKRRIQTVHHNERKHENNQPQRQYPRIQREKLVPLTQVKEEDHLQQTLDAGKGIFESKITIPEKISL